MIYVIILLCGLEALKYYFRLLYQEYEALYNGKKVRQNPWVSL